MKNPRLRIACCTMMVVCHFAALSEMAIDYRNPAEVKQMIEQIMREPLLRFKRYVETDPNCP